MLFEQQHLKGSHYEWPPNKNSGYCGKPTRRVFDRYNGYQVLYLINYCISADSPSVIDEGRKIEHCIQFHLPLRLMSEISAATLLLEQMNRNTETISDNIDLRK